MSRAYVIHLPPDLHERWKQFCKQKGKTMAKEASRLIEDALRGQKKPLRLLDETAQPETPPWALPPFWKGGQH